MAHSHSTVVHEPLAITGMACRLPGAHDIESLWQMCVTGGCGICEIPKDRMDSSLYFDPVAGTPCRVNFKRAGCVPFSPLCSDLEWVPDDIVSAYDPAHITLLNVVSDALKDSGTNPEEAFRLDAGVFIGNSSGGSDRPRQAAWARQVLDGAEIAKLAASPDLNADSAFRTALAEAAASIREESLAHANPSICNFTPGTFASAICCCLNLTGPSTVVDAACASGLVALNLGAHALWQRRVSTAIVATAAVRKLHEWLAIARAGASSSGESRPFDAAANGLVSSDGYVAIVVRRLRDAIADNVPVHAVIRGIGISTDGRGKGFWSPQESGQIAAIQRAYACRDDMSHVQFIEAHATSTQVGDVTEIGSLVKAFPHAERDRVPLGTLKAHIGHTLESAGLAGLVRTVLAMKHRTIPPVSGVSVANPLVDWNKSPFYLPDRCEVWKPGRDGHPRRAGINAFGIGGINAHVVLDEYVPTHFRRTVGNASRESLRETGDRSNHAFGGRHASVAVVGCGVVLPDAHSLQSFRAVLQSLHDRSDTPHPNGTGTTLSGYVFDWKRFRIPPKQLHVTNPLRSYLIDAADQAIRDAAIDLENADRDRIGVVVGSIFHSDFVEDVWFGTLLPHYCRRLTESLVSHRFGADEVRAVCESTAQKWLQSKPAVLDETAGISSATLASSVARQFDLRGGAYSLDAGDLSSVSAVASAIQWLRSGEIDTVICLGGQNLLKGAFLSATMQTQQNRNSAAVAFSEGCAALVLRLLDNVHDADQPVRGVIDDATVWTRIVGRTVESGSGRVDHPVVSFQSGADPRVVQSDNLRRRVVSTVGNVPGSSDLTVLVAALVDDSHPSDATTRISSVSTIGWAGPSEQQGEILLRQTHSSVGNIPARESQHMTRPARVPTQVEFPETTGRRAGLSGSAELRSHRGVTRLIPMPLEPPEQPTSTSMVFLFGGGPMLDELSRLLESRSIECCNLDRQSGLTDIFRQLEARWNSVDVCSLVLIGSAVAAGKRDVRDEATGGEGPTYAKDACLVCREWLRLVRERGNSRHAVILGATALGGDFGQFGRVESNEDAAISGLLRSLHREMSVIDRVRTHLVDMSPHETARLAAREIADELLLSAALPIEAPIVESTYTRGRRHVPVFIPRHSGGESRSRVTASGRWIVMGMIAPELRRTLSAFASHFGVHLHLVGSHLPAESVPQDMAETVQLHRSISREARECGQSPHQAWRSQRARIETAQTLKFLDSARLCVEFHQWSPDSDVPFECVLRHIEQTHGPIRGLLYCVEPLQPVALISQTEDEVRSAIGDGAASAIAMTSLATLAGLEHLVVLDPTGSRFGLSYQSLLSAKAEKLSHSALFRGLKSRSCRTVVLRMPVVDSDLPQLPGFVDPFPDVASDQCISWSEAAAHLIAELTNESSDGEVLVYRDDTGNPDAVLCGWTTLSPKVVSTLEVPLIDQFVQLNENEAIGYVTLAPDHDPFLTDHCDGTVPILPTVIGIEVCVEAISLMCGSASAPSIVSCELVNGLRMPARREHHLRVHVSRSDGKFECIISGEIFGERHECLDTDRRLMRCTLSLAHPDSNDRQTFPVTSGERRSLEIVWSGVCESDESTVSPTVNYGHRLRCLTDLKVSAEWATAVVVVPAPGELSGDRCHDGWCTAAAVIDAVLAQCDLFAAARYGTKQFPIRVDNLWLRAIPHPGSKLDSIVQFHSRNDREIMFDFSLQDSTARTYFLDGKCIFAIS